MEVRIRKFKEKDIPNKIKWINNSENNQYLHYDLPLEYEKTLNWFKKNKDRRDRYDGIIEVNSIPVGLIGLLSIDMKNSKAEYYIALGETKFKGKGIAKLASIKLLEYAFKEIGINKIYLFTEVENKSAQKLFERVGFKKEGLLKEDIKNGNEFADRYVYGICKEDYYNKKERDKNEIKPTEIVELKDKLYSNNIYMKRDDLIPFSFGGNKARKAKLFFEDIKEIKSDCVVTYGSSSSNHCRIIANIAASKGLPCYIISPSAEDNITYNRKITNLFEANIIKCPVSEVSDTIDSTLEELR
ncbi:MAG TPA: GNAT family N-acetyltransferase, partial [Tissierellaceae bacterium]|nr:GNAT family N-acetyltransferase [Tissierellaceae bacterium]